MRERPCFHCGEVGRAVEFYCPGCRVLVAEKRASERIALIPAMLERVLPNGPDRLVVHQPTGGQRIIRNSLVAKTESAAVGALYWFLVGLAKYDIGPVASFTPWVSVRWLSAPEILDQWPFDVDDIERVSVLVMTDVGMEQRSPRNVESLWRVLNARRGRMTIVTTHLLKQSLQDTYNPQIAKLLGDFTWEAPDGARREPERDERLHAAEGILGGDAEADGTGSPGGVHRRTTDGLRRRRD